jgi:CheY-like chemotaxis protein
MTAPSHASLRQMALTMLARRAGPAARADAIAAAADRAYDDLARVLAAGFQAHVAKPVDPVELTAAIAAVTHLQRDRERPRS